MQETIMNLIPRKPPKIKEEELIPVLSFFTGGGFLDMGFELAGFRIVWTNECNSDFKKMYEYGTTTWRRSLDPHANKARIIDCLGIEEITANEILENAFPDGRPLIFGAIGGPPCPDFTRSGKNRGSDGKHGVLSKTYVNRLCEIQPYFFVFENVPDLLRIKKQRPFLAELEGQLEEFYSLDRRIMNALEFGVPQDRERMFLIGIEKTFAEILLGRIPKKGERGWFPFPECPEYKDAKTRFNWPTIEPPGKIPVKPSEIPDELMVCSILDGWDHPGKHLNGLEHFKPFSDKFKTVCEGDDKRRSFKRLHRYRYSPTACYGHNEIHLHPWENRRLTVREAMRIQGIPDTYALPPNTTLTAKFALIGNGVPVPLAYRLARSFYDFFQGLL